QRICDAEPGTDGVGVILHEGAVAGRFKDSGAWTPARSGVWCGGAEVRGTAVFFLRGSGVVPAKAVIDSQSASYFPGILQEERPLLFEHAGVDGRVLGGRGDVAKKEVRVREASRVSAGGKRGREASRAGIRNRAGPGRAECGVSQADAGGRRRNVRLEPGFHAGLERVIAFYPGGVRVQRRPLRVSVSVCEGIA